MRLVKTTTVYPDIVVKDFFCWSKTGNGRWHMVIRDGGTDWLVVFVMVVCAFVGFVSGFVTGRM